MVCFLAEYQSSQKIPRKPYGHRIPQPFISLLKGDVPGLVHDAINLGFLPQSVDQEKLLPALQKVFDEAQLAMKEELQMEAINKTKYKVEQNQLWSFLKPILLFVLFEWTPSRRKEVGIQLGILPHVREQNNRTYFPRLGQIGIQSALGGTWV